MTGLARSVRAQGGESGEDAAGPRRPRWAIPDTTGGALLPLLQAAMLPAGAIVLGSVMHDRTRQHLYVVPGLAALTALTAYRLLIRTEQDATPRW